MRTLFYLQLAVAAVMAFMGLMVESRPYGLLDVVLSPEQLRDRDTLDSTLALMQRATGHDAVYWWLLAAVVAGIAFIGLRATPR